MQGPRPIAFRHGNIEVAAGIEPQLVAYVDGVRKLGAKSVFVIAQCNAVPPPEAWEGLAKQGIRASICLGDRTYVLDVDLPAEVPTQQHLARMAELVGAHALVLQPIKHKALPEFLAGKFDKRIVDAETKLVHIQIMFCPKIKDADTDFLARKLLADRNAKDIEAQGGSVYSARLPAAEIALLLKHDAVHYAEEKQKE